MLYITPVQESICKNGMVREVMQWSSLVQKSDPVLANTLSDHATEVDSKWLPEDNAANNLTKGYRRNNRVVFGCNGNGDIAIYARFSLGLEDVHLDWVAAKPPGSGRVDCGPGVEPLPAMMAFMATVGLDRWAPVKLLADNKELIGKYEKCGWKLTGVTQSSKAEMALAVEDFNAALNRRDKPHHEGVHWKWGGAGELLEYLRDGTK